MRQKITSREASLLFELVHELTGIALEKDKDYLLETRFSPLLERFALPDYLQLYHAAQEDETIRHALIDAIVTNESSFFRDAYPYQLMRDLFLPRLEPLARVEDRPVRIWCVACSRGQEVYSIAMTIKEMYGAIHGERFAITGTDISRAAIEQAEEGSYSKFELTRGLSYTRLQQHFQRVGDRYQVSEDLRAAAHYERLNVLDQDAWKHLGPFDLVFCRNLAVYFNLSSRTRLYEAIAKRMAHPSYLLLGSTESLNQVTDLFERRVYKGKAYHVLKGSEKDQPPA